MDTSWPAFLSMVAQYSGPSGGHGAWMVPAASGVGLGDTKLNFMVCLHLPTCVRGCFLIRLAL